MTDKENGDLNSEEEAPVTDEVAAEEVASATEAAAEEAGTEEAGTEDEAADSEEPAAAAASEASEIEKKNGEVEDGNRRKILIGAGVGAVAVAAAAYGASRLMELPEASEVTSKFVVGDLPLEDPASSLWKKAPVARIVMDGQTVSLPMKNKPAIKDIRVRSLNNGDSIGFLVEWTDPNDSDTTVQTDRFRDACAVLFVNDPSIDALRMMGAGPMPATILQWKADWQIDVEKGFQDLESVWPNTTADFYPPLVSLAHEAASETSKVVVPDAYEKANATERIAGYAANNPVALMNRKTAVEKVIGKGPGTAADFDTQDARGWGMWRGNKWRVALGKSMKATNQDEITVPKSGEIGVAFAIWRGDESDRGARKSPCKKLIKLIIEGA